MSSDEFTSPVDVLKRAVKPGEDGKCCRCHRTEHEDGSPITWKCAWCDQTVCRDCTLTRVQDGATIYYDDTLCSDACWRYIGRPEE